MTSDFEMAPFELSAVLQAQMVGDARRDGDPSGPRALMIAVLEEHLRRSFVEEGVMSNEGKTSTGRE